VARSDVTEGERSRDRLETGFPGLDLIRFAAALMVVLYHLTYVGPGQLGARGAALYAAFAPAQPLTSALWVAVPIFFVLSGVVIAFSAQGRSAGAFIRRRAMRLYPAAILSGTVTVLVWPKPDWLGRYIRSVTLWPSGPWVSDVYWTMAVELTFYAMVALALALGGSRWLGRLARALVLISAGWWALRVANLAGGDLLRPLIERVQTVDPILLLSHGCFFGLGMILFERRALGPTRQRDALGALATLTCVAAVVSSARSFGYTAEGLWGLAIPAAIWLAALAAMLVGLARGGGPRPGAYPRLVREAGLATYPLYLVHAEVGLAIMLVLEPLGPLAALALAVAAVLLLVLAILAGERLIRTAITGKRRSDQ